MSDDYLEQFDGRWVVLCLHGDSNEDFGVDSVHGPFDLLKEAIKFGEMNFSLFAVDVLLSPDDEEEL